MKLVEALKQRKQLINEINVLEERLLGGMVYYPEAQEKSLTPSGIYTKSECDKMVKTLNEKRQELIKLKVAICEANNEAIEEDGTSIQKLVIERGEMGAVVSFSKKLREKCDTQNSSYYTTDTDLKRKTMYTAKDIDADIDEATIKLGELDTKLSQLNQRVDVRLD